nr:60s ribosomal protein l12-3 [Quercus suber]
MPPKLDPLQVVDVYVQVTGGEVRAASSLTSTLSFDDDGYTSYNPHLASQQLESFSNFNANSNGKYFDGGFGASDDPTLPPPSEMQSEEGFALREK